METGRENGDRGEKKMYVIIDGLGSKAVRAHCHNSAQMMNSEPVGTAECEEKHTLVTA